MQRLQYSGNIIRHRSTRHFPKQPADSCGSGAFGASVAFGGFGAIIFRTVEKRFRGRVAFAWKLLNYLMHVTFSR